MQKIAFIVYYHKHNFYSLNAILGALETDQIFQNLDFFFVRENDDLIEKVEKLVIKYPKVVIAISFFTTQIFATRELVKKLKHRFKNEIIIIAGGSHPTGDPSGTLNMGFDIVVIGEGEKTIIELIQKIINNHSIEIVKGIAYENRENKYILTGKREFINLDDYPPFPIKNTRFGAI
ncbi:MAG: cobalamin-dependent protein, partial [Candidatus Thorarchaeota archaeon]